MIHNRLLEELNWVARYGVSNDGTLAYLAYAVSAAQFLSKFRMARRQAPAPLGAVQ